MSQPLSLPSYVKTWHTSSTPSISPYRPELSAKGKSIIITGAGTGIGAQIGLSFAKAGASFIGIIGRREEKLVASKAAIEKVAAPGTKVVIAVADVVKVSELEQAFRKFHDAFGPIDILVSNAGYLNHPTTAVEADSDDWWRAIEINVKGTFNSIRAFLPLAGPNPILLNITSGVAHLPVMPGMSAYAASKIANAKLVEYIANETPELRAINVQPGVVKTEMNDKHGLIPPMDNAELPGDFCVWLASPEAKFLNGKFVYVNWDVDELKARASDLEKNPHDLTLVLQGAVYP